MSNKLTDEQNVGVGIGAAFVEGILLQPTLYWKNAAAQQLPFTLNPRVIYRGTAASILNEMQMMAIQFGLTGYLQRLIVGGDMTAKLTQKQEISMAAAGGTISALATNPVELVMIQQQRGGGSLIGAVQAVISKWGVSGAGLYRGILPCFARDAIYVTGMLGVTPVVQKYLMEKHGMTMTGASFNASIVGGVFAAMPSHPFDVVKTCMQGDMAQKEYTGTMQAARKVWAQGGIRRMYNGCFWRTFNIVATVYVANECQNLFVKHFVDQDEPGQ
jgi:hypothetical protein